MSDAQPATADTAELAYTLADVNRRVSRGEGLGSMVPRLLQSLMPFIDTEGEGLCRRDRARLQTVLTPALRTRRQPYSCQAGNFVIVWVSDEFGLSVWWLARVVATTSLTVTVEYEGKLPDNVCFVSLLQWPWCAASMPLWKVVASHQIMH